jgi:DNA replication and repair protein RecF
MGACSLIIEILSVRNFRNLCHVDVELGAGLNVLFGDNGQGKTNFLEALYALATTQSFRTSRAAEMIATGQPMSSLRGRIDEQGQVREQSVGMRRGGRTVRIDGKRPPTLAAYALATPVVAFHPGAIALAGGPSAERRKLLDRVALHVSPSSLEDGRAYARALRSRQRSLEGRGDSASDLDGWEDLMVEHGMAITAARANAAEALALAASRSFANLGAPSAMTLSARYESGSPPSPEAFRTDLRSHRVRDRARRSASVGPHRDDLKLSLGGLPVRGVASQGQQRAVTLALQLAEIEVVEQVRAVRPILLLDDVSSELDDTRTHALVAALRRDSRQVVLTTTRPELIAAAGLSEMDQRRDFRVTDGVVARV